MSFTGIVLAGGRSSRMGRDKAMLDLGGSTLLDIAISLLREAGAARVVVSGERPTHAGVADRIAALGPVGGLASALAHCDDGAAVVLPVDMPRLDVAAITALRDALASAPAASFEAYPLPCALVVDARARGLVDALLVREPTGPSMRAVLHELGAVRLPVDDARCLGSVNTPADWAALST